MKISTANIDRIMEKCTKKEIDLIMYIGQFQDEYGVIKGLDYKDIITNVEICKSTFYKLLYSLEKKGIIQINYINEYSFWEVTIVDNVFSTKDDYKKGYLKLNYRILHSKEFKAMTKSEKLIVLHLFKMNDFRTEMIKVTYHKIMEWVGKSLRSVKKFMDTLSKVFKVIKKGNLCLVGCLRGFGTRMTSEADIANTHTINYRLKKFKCQASETDIKDVCTLFKQFTGAFGTEKIVKAIDTIIQQFGTLIPKYVNKTIHIC